MSQHALLLHSWNFGILTLLFFIVGMIKPKWVLFFLQKPTRFLVTNITIVCFMIVMTIHGAGSKQVKVAEKHKKKPDIASVAPVPVPVPEPVPVPSEKPKEAAKKK
jgi:hypothetical protein